MELKGKRPDYRMSYGIIKDVQFSIQPKDLFTKKDKYVVTVLFHSGHKDEIEIKEGSSIDTSKLKSEVISTYRYSSDLVKDTFIRVNNSSTNGLAELLGRSRTYIYMRLKDMNFCLSDILTIKEKLPL